MRSKKNKLSSNPQKKSRVTTAPEKPVCSTNFTPAANQPMDIDTNNAESQWDETDIEEVGDEADAYERVHNTLCVIANDLLVLYIV